MSIGAVLDEAWTIYTKFFAKFFLIAVILFGGVNLLLGLLATLDADAGTLWLVLLLGILATIVANFWLQGALVGAVADARDGTFDAPLGDVIKAATSHIAGLIGVGIVAGLGIGLGFLALIVPGLWLMTIWAVVAPVVVIEGKGVFEALGRSRELVRGHGWTVFGLVVVTGILSYLAATLLQAVFAFLGDFGETFIGGTIAYGVVAPFTAIVVTIAYFRLREHEQGAAAVLPPAEPVA